MANELSDDIEKARRFLLPIGSLIMLFLISYPALHLKIENLPLIIDLAILSLAFLAVGMLFYYRPGFCISQRGKWLPPFNAAIIAALCPMIILWSLADIDYEVKAPMVMILFSLGTFFAISEGTYIWKLQGE
jgi:hypothetical protein